MISNLINILYHRTLWEILLEMRLIFFACWLCYFDSKEFHISFSSIHKNNLVREKVWHIVSWLLSSTFRHGPVNRLTKKSSMSYSFFSEHSFLWTKLTSGYDNKNKRISLLNSILHNASFLSTFYEYHTVYLFHLFYEFIRII